MTTANQHPPTRSFSASLRTRLRAWTRVFALLMTLFLFVGFSATSIASAQIGEGLLGFGAELSQWPGIRPHSGERTLRLNGAGIHVRAFSENSTLASALNRSEQYCESVSGLQLPAKALETLGATPELTFRQDEATEGTVACLDFGRDLRLDELLTRLRRFSETGDIQDIGHLRYFYSRVSGSEVTTLAIWTEGETPLKRMFPVSGDAPGRDPEKVPRIPGSKRILSSSEEGHPYSAAVYRVSETSPDPIMWTKKRLKDAGWSVTTSGASALHATQEGRRLIFTFQEKKRLWSVAELS